MIKRYDELDSIRGIAALMVMLGHFLAVFPYIGFPIIHSTFGNVFSFVWNGHSAVIMFFVLSGFVLSLPFYREGNFKYRTYIIKRVCRIYIPYFVVIMLTIVFLASIANNIGMIQGLVWWGWKTKVSLPLIINHIVFLGEYDSNAYLMVIWSLVQEMRVSVIYPFIVMFLLRSNWKIGIVVAVVLSCFSCILMNKIPTQFNNPLSTNYFITLHYAAIFIAGSLIAKHKEFLVKKISTLNLSFIALLLGFLLFNYTQYIYMIIVKFIPRLDYFSNQINDWIIVLGVILIILSSLSSRIFSKLLLVKPINFMGKISYSLYLVHPVVLMSLIYILFDKIPNQLIVCIAFVLVFPVSYLCHKYIEEPSIKLGKILIGSSKKIKNKQASA